MEKIRIKLKDLESFKKELIENYQFPEEEVNSLTPGYYFISDDKLIKVNEWEYYVNDAIPEFVIATSALTGTSTLLVRNSELRTERYGETSDEGFRTGHGEAFEDINNRKLRKEGHKVDSSVGKNYKWGGPDAIVDGEEVQYKCYNSYKKVVDSIIEHDCYPGQKIYVNSENAELVKQRFTALEAEGKVKPGTAERIYDSGITRELAIKVSQRFTKESLKFDAETAKTTGIVIMITAASAYIICKVIKEKEIKPKTVLKGVVGGALIGVIGFAIHILFNQFRR